MKGYRGKGCTSPTASPVRIAVGTPVTADMCGKELCSHIWDTCMPTAFSTME